MNKYNVIIIKTDKKQGILIYYDYHSKKFYKLKYKEIPITNKGVAGIVLLGFVMKLVINPIVKLYSDFNLKNGFVLSILFLLAFALILYFMSYNLFKYIKKQDFKYLEEVYLEEALITSFLSKNRKNALITMIIIIIFVLTSCILFLQLLSNPNSNMLPVLWVMIVITASIHLLVHPIELYKFSKIIDYKDLDQYGKMREEENNEENN